MTCAEDLVGAIAHPAIVTGLPNGDFLAANRRFLETFNVSRAELARTRTIFHYCHIEERDDIVSRILRDGRVERRPLRLRRGDGSTFAVVFSARLEHLDSSVAILTTLHEVVDGGAAPPS